MKPRRTCLVSVALAGLLLLAGCGDDEPVRPPDAPSFPGSEDEVLAALQTAYAGRDLDLLAGILASPEDGATYVFEFGAPLPDGTTSWDVVEELRIHRRMFRLEDPGPYEPPVPPPSELVSVSGTFNRQSLGWTELREFYRSSSNPDGLEPSRWRATGAPFQYDALIETQTENDYRVDGLAGFVVIEDLSKAPGTARKFLLYRWVEPREYPGWSRIKAYWR